MSNESKETADQPGLRDEQIIADRLSAYASSGGVMDDICRSSMRQAAKLLRAALAASAAKAVPEIDYKNLIAACYARTGHAQGTRGCIAFAKGAEWFREQALAAAPTPAAQAPEVQSPAVAHGYQPAETAPRDGTPFVWVQTVRVVSATEPMRYEHNARVVRRVFSKPGSCGYWMGFGGSIADHMLTGHWAPLPESQPPANPAAHQPTKEQGDCAAQPPEQRKEGE